MADERLYGSEVWRPCAPEFRLVRPMESKPDRDLLAVDLAKDLLVDEHKATAFAAFRALLPGHIVPSVETFCSHQWSLLVLLHEYREACDLVDNNPVLAYALANHALFRGTRLETAGGYAGQRSTDRQRDILKWLGFPGTESTVRLFRKIVAESASPPVLRQLRNALLADDRTMRMLAHVPRINAGVLWTVVNPVLRNCVSQKLLLAIATNEDDMFFGQTPDRLATVLALLTESGQMGPATPLTTFAQVERLQQGCDLSYRKYLVRREGIRKRTEAVIEEKAKKRQDDEDAKAQRRRIRQKRLAEKAEQKWMEHTRQQRQLLRANQARLESEWRRREQETLRRLTVEKERQQRILASGFPPPPMPGTGDIIPLTTEAELIKEGEDQHNCVGGYNKLVKDGNFYVYRVLQPERATLSVVRGADGGWLRSELKTAGNARPNPETVRHVDNWVGRHSLSV